MVYWWYKCFNELIKNELLATGRVSLWSESRGWTGKMIWEENRNQKEDKEIGKNESKSGRLGRYRQWGHKK